MFDFDQEIKEIGAAYLKMGGRIFVNAARKDVGSFYPETGVIMLQDGTDYGTWCHELGHAMDWIIGCHAGSQDYFTAKNLLPKEVLEGLKANARLRGEYVSMAETAKAYNGKADLADWHCELLAVGIEGYNNLSGPAQIKVQALMKLAKILMRRHNWRTKRQVCLLKRL